MTTRKKPPPLGGGFPYSLIIIKPLTPKNLSTSFHRNPARMIPKKNARHAAEMNKAAKAT